MSGAKVLVVDDDPAILRAVRRALEGRDYNIDTADSCATALASVRSFRPEVILLDLVLPDGTGIDVCRALRVDNNVPVIVLSAVGDDQRKVEALDAGADDYLTKPFSIDELQARIRVALRRSANLSLSTVLHAGPLALDIASHKVTVDGQPVHLTPKEFDLCRVLMENQGKIITQRQLLARVWGAEYVDDSHILRTFVHQLRAKIGAKSSDAADLISNDPGVGYRMSGQG
ncbi:MAG: response regulator transcription factor [Tepidiformaceae bacterium]